MAFSSSMLQLWLMHVQCKLIGVPAPSEIDAANAAEALQMPSPEFLEQASRALSKTQFENVIDARKVEGRCGWPACASAPTAAPNALVAFMARKNPDAVVDVLARGNFCTSAHETAARLLHRQLPSDPIWTRSESAAVSSWLEKKSHRDWLDLSGVELAQLRGISPFTSSEPAPGHSTPSISAASPFEIKIVEHSGSGKTDNVTAAPAPAASSSIEGYLPSTRHALPSARTAAVGPKASKKSAGEDEDDDEQITPDDLSDDDLEALYSGKKPAIALPALSDFSLLFAEVDGWVDDGLLRFLANKGQLPRAFPISSKQNIHEDVESDEEEELRSVVSPDGADAASARRSSYWSFLLPRMRSSLDKFTQTRGFVVEHAAIISQAQKFVLEVLPMLRSPQPLQSRHWTALAHLLLWPIIREFHIDLFPLWHDYLRGVWMSAAEELQQLLQLFE